MTSARSPQKHVNVALLGYGLAGRVFHAPLLSANPSFNISVILTANPERAHQARTDHPRARVVADAREVWDSGSPIDLTVVASANSAHVSQTLHALAHGSHVVVDKPIAATAQQARELRDAAAAAGRHLYVFQNRRWDSDFLTLCAVAKRLGPIHRLESRFERWRPDPRGVWRESSRPQDGGGQLLDLGSHLVDQALVLLGPAESVSARVNRLRDQDAADDDAIITLNHQSGATSLLFVSAVTAIPGPRFRMLGASGGLLIHRPDSQEERLRLGADPASHDWGLEPADHSALMILRDGSASQVPLERGNWPEFYRRVLLSMGGDGPSPVSITDVIETMRILDAARESNGQLIPLM